MADVYERILEIVATMDESDNSVLITGINWYRDRSFLDATDPFSITFTDLTGAVANAEAALGSQGWTPSVIRIASTFQA